MKLYRSFLLLSAMLFSVVYGCREHSGSTDENTAAVISPDETASEGCGFSTEGLTETGGKVKKNEVFSGLLMRLGMSAGDAYLLSDACSPVFDVRKFRAGNSYKAYYSESGPSDGIEAGDIEAGARSGQERKLEYLVYDKDSFTQVVFRCTPPFEAFEIAKPVTVKQKYADVTIRSSLWNDMIDADVSPLLVLTLSDIYAWTVDFFGLQKGDRFRVFYDEKSCDGKVVAVDTVRYAVFTHAGQDFPAVMFDQGDGGNVYWNLSGESMRKAFLKAPLKYSRISSGFSYARRHPITRRVQPHTGVDYAAPTGTPVMTIGDGVVTSMRNEGAGGNTVRIKHNSIYSTAYLHLSRFASGLRPGTRVTQGQVIGYVGSTGRSTGPHLDFRVWKNGTPVNPLKMESPPAEPLKAEFREAFDSLSADYSFRMDMMSAESVVEALFEAL